MKTCRAVRARLLDSFEHALEIEETLAIEAHLSDCGKCAEEARRARLVHESFTQLAESPLARLDVERSVSTIRAAIDRRTVAPPSRRWRWIAAAAGFVALVIAARIVFGGSAATGTREPQLVDDARTNAPGVRANTDGAAGTRPPDPDAHVELAPLEPIDTARLEESRASVREAIVAQLPTLQGDDVAGFVDGVDRATNDLARSGWPIARIVERLADDADAGVANGALRWLGRRGDPSSLRKLETALVEPDRRDSAAAALIDALAKREPEVLASILGRCVRVRQKPLEARFALDLVVRERLEAALPWIEDLARERALRGDEALTRSAIDTIASFDSVNALRALLRMRSTNRFTPELVEPALTAHFERSPRSAIELASDRASARRAEELRSLNEALLGFPRAAFVPAWIELAAARELPRGDRRFAILLVGEHGRDADVESLADLLRRCDRNERDLKAAVLIALHRIGGEAALEKALSATPKEPRARILELFQRSDRGDRPETNLLELAQRLEPLIAPLQL